ncbi:hypothetical protein [Candidatus Epulonipiscium viviparus]|uniref:hypothetical protein n=1 Tax=Candidatus Epulonipiscium viviparus TaxID=420336 RepID=UPI002738047F|nr:hypothetical protein [Candidatus Epulopiscium viviparus]
MYINNLNNQSTYNFNYVKNTPVLNNTKDDAIKVAETQNSLFNPSQHGKSLSVIKTMSTQKEKIVNDKNKLITETLANGGSLFDIEAELAAYEKQLHNLEEKLSKENVKQQQEVTKQNSQDPKIYSNRGVLLKQSAQQSMAASITRPNHVVA